MNLADRFMQFVFPEPNSGCWLWDSTDDGNGYGTITVDNRPLKAHCVSYNLFVGPIPDGLQIDHKCRIRCCVNPDHLEPVTQRENILRGEGRAALNARKLSCNSGHEFTVENTMVFHRSGRTYRACRECQRIRQRKPSALASQARLRDALGLPASGNGGGE